MARYIKTDGARLFVSDFVCEQMKKIPSAKVVEVKHGKWKQGVPYICSVCGKPAPEEKNTSERYSCWASPYCPHCGAKMDGKRKKNDKE